MLLSSRPAVLLQARPSRAAAVRVSARAAGPRGGLAAASPLRFNIHGRHVEVTPPVERMVQDKLSGVLNNFKGAQFIEGEGGVSLVDVRLMNSRVELSVRPVYQNKQLHDTFLRQGEIKVLEFGGSMQESLDKAVATLEKKLRRLRKAPPTKKDYRKL